MVFWDGGEGGDEDENEEVEMVKDEEEETETETVKKEEDDEETNAYDWFRDRKIERNAEDEHSKEDRRFQQKEFLVYEMYAMT